MLNLAATNGEDESDEANQRGEDALFFQAVHRANIEVSLGQVQFKSVVGLLRLCPSGNRNPCDSHWIHRQWDLTGGGRHYAGNPPSLRFFRLRLAFQFLDLLLDLLPRFFDIRFHFALVHRQVDVDLVALRVGAGARQAEPSR